jgi:hypothetical protein
LWRIAWWLSGFINLVLLQSSKAPLGSTGDISLWRSRR